MIQFRGKQFIKDIVNAYVAYGNIDSNIFQAIYKVQQKTKNILLDTRILDFAIRYRVADVISGRELKEVFSMFCNENIAFIKKKLLDKLDLFQQKLLSKTEKEIGREVIKENIESEINTIYRVLQFFGD